MMRVDHRQLAQLLFAVVALIASAVALAAAPGVVVPPYERVQLPNGAVLLLMERRDVPLIAFHALVRGGAMSDAPDKVGAASLLAGLLEKGAGERDALAFAETIASVGGDISAGASLESISVSGTFLARDQQLMIELLADLLQRPQLAADQFDALRARHIEFLRAAKDSDLSALTPLYGARALFAEHPYGRPVGGSEASLAALKLEDVKRYYEQHVGGDRLILAIAGDFKASAMRRLATQAFGSWRKAPAPFTPPAPAQAPQSRRVLLVDAPDSVQSYFWAGSLGVARGDPRRAALDVVNTLFGGRFTSMLNTELRIRSGLSYGASSHFDRLQHGGSWDLSSFTQTEKTLEAIDLAFATLDRLHAGGLPADQLASAKSYVQGQFPLGFETSAQWAAQLASLELHGLGREFIENYANALGGVTNADAQRVISEVFPQSNRTVLVVIGNASAIRDSLRKFGPITEMKLAEPSFSPMQGAE